MEGEEAVAGGAAVGVVALAARGVATGDPGTYLIWSPGLSRKKPKVFDGWKLLLKERELRLYGPATG